MNIEYDNNFVELDVNNDLLNSDISTEEVMQLNVWKVRKHVALIVLVMKW